MAEIKYDNSGVRRQDRLLDPESAMELLARGEYGFLSLNGETYPYGIPLNYVYADGKIYIHCAPEGKKLRLIDRDGRVGFCVVGPTEVRPSQFTTGYRSVVITGTSALVECDEEKRTALRLFVGKYSPGHIETGMKYIGKSFARTAVIRIDIDTVSGKTKL